MTLPYLQHFKQVMFRVAPEILAGICLGAFLLAKSETFHWYLSDENIYYFLASSLSVDTLPYRDFFYANPPLLLVFLMISGEVFDWTPFGLRVVPLIATILSGLAIHRTFRPSLGAVAVLPVLFFVFTDIALRAGTHATGINVALMFVLLSYWAVFSNRPMAGAALLTLGLWTKFYVVAALPGLLLAVFLCSPQSRLKEVLRFLGIFLAGGMLLAVVGTLFGGWAFWEQNFLYHLAKPERSGSGFSETAARVSERNFMSLCLFAGIIAMGALSGIWIRFGGKSRSLPRTATTWLTIGTLHLVVTLAFLALQSRVFDFYFLLFFPGVILLLGGALLLIRHALQDAFAWRAILETALLAAAVFLLGQPLVPYQHRLLMKPGAGAPVPYWDHERRHQDRLADWARGLNLPPDATACGDSVTAPIFALASGRGLALGEADTNAMRFRAGFPTAEEFISQLEEVEVDYLLVRTEKRSGRGETFTGLFLLPEFQTYLRDSFEPFAMIETDSRTTIRLFARKPKNG